MPRMFSPLPTPMEMASWDAASINEVGIRGEVLMENASRAATHILSEHAGTVEGKRISIICGPGNNGGDGFAMGRQLMDLGARVTIFHTHPKIRYKGESGYNLRLAANLGIDLKHIPDSRIPDFSGADILVDALLGTGFEGELRPKFLELVRMINKAGSKSLIFSVDIPSGLHGLKGMAQPEAVKADITATFEAAKLGLIQTDARSYTGKLVVCPIGIPAKVKMDLPPEHFSINERILHSIPSPAAGMHKGTSGHLLIIGGSPGLTGALQLAGLGALRAGAGLVTLACPSGLVPQVNSWMPELMTKDLGEGDDWDEKAIDELLSITGDYQAVVIGPGLGRSGKALDLVERFVTAGHPPAVFDADALYALSRRSHIMPELTPNSILTPHPGEMARLSSASISEIESDRMDAAQKFATAKKVFLILKGAGTVVGCPDSNVMICPISAPNLAAGGSGDILAGMTGSLLGRGLSPMQSSCIAVYWHARSGLLLEKDFPFRGNLATETANALPAVLKEVSCSKPRT